MFGWAKARMPIIEAGQSVSNPFETPPSALAVTRSETRRRPAKSMWSDRLPASVVFVDVETTGLHSIDKVVSLGAIWLPIHALIEGSFNISYLHLIFDPGRKSHPKAEEVHGHETEDRP